MYQYVVKRLLLMIPTLIGAALLVFFLLRLLPGDVCEVRLAGTGLFAAQEDIMAPNVMAPFLIMLTCFVGQAILLEAVLSYLVGMQDPTPAWGLMLKGGAEEFLESAPWLSIFPGLAIALAVFGFNLFGDALRDMLDPKLRSR